MPRGIITSFPMIPLAEHAPIFIAVLNSNMKVYGRNFFGEPEYGQEIMAWIKGEYSMFKRLRTLPYS